jgi:hypothetical protein
MFRGVSVVNILGFVTGVGRAINRDMCFVVFISSNIGIKRGAFFSIITCTDRGVYISSIIGNGGVYLSSIIGMDREVYTVRKIGMVIVEYKACVIGLDRRVHITSII